MKRIFAPIAAMVSVLLASCAAVQAPVQPIYVPHVYAIAQLPTGEYGYCGTECPRPTRKTLALPVPPTPTVKPIARSTALAPVPPKTIEDKKLPVEIRLHFARGNTGLAQEHRDYLDNFRGLSHLEISSCDGHHAKARAKKVEDYLKKIGSGATLHVRQCRSGFKTISVTRQK